MIKPRAGCYSRRDYLRSNLYTEILCVEKKKEITAEDIDLESRIPALLTGELFRPILIAAL